MAEFSVQSVTRFMLRQVFEACSQFCWHIETGILKHDSREFTNLTLFCQLSFSEIDVYAAESM